MLEKWLDEIKSECLIDEFEKQDEIIEDDFDRTEEHVLDGGKIILGVLSHKL
jgi:hypothetical protein